MITQQTLEHIPFPIIAWLLKLSTYSPLQKGRDLCLSFEDILVITSTL